MKFRYPVSLTAALAVLLTAATGSALAQSLEDTEFFIAETMNNNAFYRSHPDYSGSFKVKNGIIEFHYGSLSRMKAFDIGHLDRAITKMDRYTMRLRCGMKTDPKYKNRLGGPEAEVYGITLTCRGNAKCVETYWPKKQRTTRQKSMELTFCPTDKGFKNSKRVANAIAHYMKLNGVNVTTRDREKIGSQFD
ncbi:MAG: hypothetical protein Tsb0019_02840 [Roseibium sp.]